MISKSSSPFTALLERGTLRRMAGARSFERGDDYFASGQVEAIAEEEGTITAKVQGTRPYRVRLWIENEELDYSCTCPVGVDGEFCKHCVAVGLKWFQAGQPKVQGKRKAPAAVTMDDVRAYLSGQDKNALVEMLVERAMEDDGLRRRLFMKAAKKVSKGLDLDTYRRAIDEAVEPDGFVNYRNAYDYTHGIEEAIDSVEELLKGGHFAEVIELAEYALRAVEEAIGSVDDSDGYMGDILGQLQAISKKSARRISPSGISQSCLTKGPCNKQWLIVSRCCLPWAFY